MKYESFKKLVMERQACRNFIDKEIKQEKLEKICKLARFTPSACNSQPWKLYCVSTPEKREQVCKALQYNGRNSFLSGAKAFIVVSEIPVILKKDVTARYPADFFTKYDIGEIIAYITLTAKSLGIDSCVIGWVDGPKLKDVLEFENSEQSNLVVALGYSVSPVREKIRKDEKDFIKYV